MQRDSFFSTVCTSHCSKSPEEAVSIDYINEKIFDCGGKVNVIKGFNF